MPLVSAERLHRWKCVYCGSKDKNIAKMKMPSGVKAEESQLNGCKCQLGSGLGVVTPVTSEGYYDAIQIVSCNQCGHTDIFAHSALAVLAALRNQSVSLEDSENFVKRTHDLNHNDPMRNPESAHDLTKHHNPGVAPECEWQKRHDKKKEPTSKSCCSNHACYNEKQACSINQGVKNCDDCNQK